MFFKSQAKRDAEYLKKVEAELERHYPPGDVFYVNVREAMGEEYFASIFTLARQRTPVATAATRIHSRAHYLQMQKDKRADLVEADASTTNPPLDRSGRAL